MLEEAVLGAALPVSPGIAVAQSTREQWRSIAGGLNWGIWLAFAFELVLMLAIVLDRWRWLRTHPLEVVVVLLTPPFAPSRLQAVRALRLLRLIRVLRVARFARQLSSLDG